MENNEVEKEQVNKSRFKYFFPFVYFFLFASADYSNYKAKRDEEDRKAGISKNNEAPTFTSVAGQAGLFGLIFAVFLIFPFVFVELPFIAPIMFIYFKKKEKENGGDGLPLDWVDLLKVAIAWMPFVIGLWFLVVSIAASFNNAPHHVIIGMMTLCFVFTPVPSFFLYKWLFGKGVFTKAVEKTRQKICEAAELDDQGKNINS